MEGEGISVTEGKATIYFPTQKGVFYNPPQIPNRDLSVMALQRFRFSCWKRGSGGPETPAATVYTHTR